KLVQSPERRHRARGSGVAPGRRLHTGYEAQGASHILGVTRPQLFARNYRKRCRDSIDRFGNSRRRDREHARLSIALSDGSGLSGVYPMGCDDEKTAHHPPPAAAISHQSPSAGFRMFYRARFYASAFATTSDRNWTYRWSSILASRSRG